MNLLSKLITIIILILGVMVSRDVFPDYDFVRYGILVAGVGSIFIGNHNYLIRGIAIIEILISCVVVFEKVNNAEIKINKTEIAKLQSQLLYVPKFDKCDSIKNWEGRVICHRSIKENTEHNKPIKKQIAELKSSASIADIFKSDPSLLAFLVFSCSFPLLSFIGARNENVVIEKEVDRNELDIKTMIINRLQSGRSNSSIGRELKIDRRRVAQVRREIGLSRTTNAQSMSNVVKFDARKKA